MPNGSADHLHVFVLCEVLGCEECDKEAHEACRICWFAVCKTCRNKGKTTNAA